MDLLKLVLAISYFFAVPFLLSIPGRIQRLFVKDPVPERTFSACDAVVGKLIEMAEGKK